MILTVGVIGVDAAAGRNCDETLSYNIIRRTKVKFS